MVIFHGKLWYQRVNTCKYHIWRMNGWTSSNNLVKKSDQTAAARRSLSPCAAEKRAAPAEPHENQGRRTHKNGDLASKKNMGSTAVRCCSFQMNQMVRLLYFQPWEFLVYRLCSGCTLLVFLRVFRQRYLSMVNRRIHISIQASLGCRFGWLAGWRWCRCWRAAQWLSVVCIVHCCAIFG